MGSIIIETAKDGNPVPKVEGFQLHSLYQPAKEGCDQAEKFLLSIDKTDKPLLVLGLGFGYHILPLLNKFSMIYVAESNQELLKLASETLHMKPLFDQCKIIDNLTKVPYIPESHVFTLRSELRFQEKFFNDVQQACKIADKKFTPNRNQIRVLINSPVYGGSYTTARYVETALKSLEVSTHFTDQSVAYGLLQKYLLNPSANAGLIAQLTTLLSETLWHEILEFKPHIVFFNAQSPFDDKLMKAIKQAGIVSIYWFVEDFRRLAYWREVCNNFDYFFMIQKGEFEGILQRSCRTIWGWFPVAAEPKIHKRIKLSDQDESFYGSDISFMGAAYPNRVSFFQHFNRHNLKLWGTGWSEALPDYIVPLNEQRITPEQSNMIYQATKVNINLHSAIDGVIEPGDFVNPRTFEIAACGGFQLVDDRDAIRDIFDVDTDIICFKSVEEAIDKANFYLDNEPLRKIIAASVREKVLKFHTYDKRLSNMLDIG